MVPSEKKWLPNTSSLVYPCSLAYCPQAFYRLLLSGWVSANEKENCIRLTIVSESRCVRLTFTEKKVLSFNAPELKNIRFADKILLVHLRIERSNQKERRSSDANGVQSI